MYAGRHASLAICMLDDADDYNYLIENSCNSSLLKTGCLT